MLDLMTLISAMGVQQELSETRKTCPAIREEGVEESGMLEQAADQLSSAFQSFENALSDGVESIFGTQEEETTLPPTLPKKVA
mmetsp:Transcript_66187/g.104736  ORF Transcript_66187/g.104736 Transcript_66187/m.104736 type:complete len:83 (-) Transcript_66187:161-409(-)